VSYSDIFKHTYKRWASLKNVKLHVFTDDKSKLKFAKKCQIHEIAPTNFKIRKHVGTIYRDFSIAKFDIISMLDDIEGDDFLITGVTHFPTQDSFTLKSNLLAFSDSDGYMTFDCFSFNRKTDAAYIKLLQSFATFVFDNEDYFEFINKSRITNDFILNLFERSYQHCFSDRLVPVKLMMTTPNTDVRVVDNVCFVQNTYFNTYHKFDSKYELVVKNKLSLMRHK
jgi:hypothetical protein